MSWSRNMQISANKTNSLGRPQASPRAQHSQRNNFQYPEVVRAL